MSAVMDTEFRGNYRAHTHANESFSLNSCTHVPTSTALLLSEECSIGPVDTYHVHFDVQLPQQDQACGSSRRKLQP